VAKNIERIGDHATNIAEIIHYLVLGRQIDRARPKGDTTSFAVVTPGEPAWIRPADEAGE
jgi:phosphate transport system protein